VIESNFICSAAFNLNNIAGLQIRVIESRKFSLRDRNNSFDINYIVGRSRGLNRKVIIADQNIPAVACNNPRLRELVSMTRYPT